jgi:hypothetical protein
LSGLKKLLAMLPASLPAGVDGTPDEMAAADFVLVGRREVFVRSFLSVLDDDDMTTADFVLDGRRTAFEI